MRFLILTQYFPPEIGGAPTRLQSMAEQLVRQGHEVEVVTARPNYPRGKIFDGQGSRFYVRESRNHIVVHRIWVYAAIGGGLARILNYTSFAFASLFALFRAHKPDYLFVESPPLLNCIPAVVAKIVWRIPYIFNVSDLWPDAVVDGGFIGKEGIAHRILLAMEMWAYQHAVYVNGVTQGIRDVLISKKNVPVEKVLFFPNGVDTVRYHVRPPDMELKNALGLQEKRIILWAGTIGFAHGLEFVLQAAKILQADSEVHFLFLGDGSARRSLEQQKAEFNLANVTFLDPVPIENLLPYYSIAECGLASLCAIPAHEGARPSKIFPVLASGKPVIFVGTGECARLIESSRAGIVVPPENPESLACEIRKLLAEPALTRELGENGRRFVEIHYEWSSIVTNWLGHLHPDQERPAVAPRVSATQ